jgi:hypothetical protein
MAGSDSSFADNGSGIQKSPVEAHDVRVKFEFISLGEIDTMNEKFQASIKIKSWWETDDKIVAYSPKQHWNPKLYIENRIDAKKKVTYKLSEKNGKTTVIETLVLKGMITRF